jgi:hypothetical protein
MIRLRHMGTMVAAGVLLAACGAPAGNDNTDRESRTLAEAIGYPRQDDAAGLVRALLATQLGKSDDFSVLEATDLDHHAPTDPMARLVWRLHENAYDAPYAGVAKHVPAVDACYRVEFDYYGPVSQPSRITCPNNAVRLPPPPPVARHDIPPNMAPALETTLGALPTTPTEADVRAALATGLPTPPVDADTGLARVPPQIFVRVKGSDVGVALFARLGADSKDCVQGHRVGGSVLVWTLTARDLGPLEKPCSAEAALTGP